MNPNPNPPEIEAAGVGAWYEGLNDPSKVKVRRYLSGIDTSSAQAFFIDLMLRSEEDHNYGLSSSAGSHALSLDMDEYDRFRVTEAYIDGLYGSGKYEEAKEQCCLNLDRFPAVRDRFLQENGGELPKNIRCRNRLIDILVGVECAYDEADGILEDYVELGIMDPDELSYRKQSLKIHRMQKTFDNIYSYRPKQRRPSRGSSGRCRWPAPRRDEPGGPPSRRPPGPPPRRRTPPGTPQRRISRPLFR